MERAKESDLDLTTDHSYNFPEPSFPYLYSGGQDSSFMGCLWKSKWDNNIVPNNSGAWGMLVPFSVHLISGWILFSLISGLLCVLYIMIQMSLKSSQLLWKRNVLRGSRSWQNLLCVKYRKPPQSNPSYVLEDVVDDLVPDSGPVSLSSLAPSKNMRLQGPHCDVKQQLLLFPVIMCLAGLRTPAYNKRENDSLPSSPSCLLTSILAVSLL